MFQEVSLATIRHGLTAAGPLIAVLTPLSNNEWEAAVGAVMTAVGLVWSIVRKVRNQPRATP